jgi:hypothetical protein
MAKAATPMRFHTNAIAATTQNDVGSLPFVISVSLLYQPECISVTRQPPGISASCHVTMVGGPGFMVIT